MSEKQKTSTSRPQGLQQMGPELYQQLRDALLELSAAAAR